MDVYLPTLKDLLRMGVHPLRPMSQFFNLSYGYKIFFLICLMQFRLVPFHSALSECGKQSGFSLLCTQLLCTGIYLYPIGLVLNTNIINPKHSNLWITLYPEINVIFIFTPVYTFPCSLAFLVILPFFFFFFFFFVFTVHSGHIFKLF